MFKPIVSYHFFQQNIIICAVLLLTACGTNLPKFMPLGEFETRQHVIDKTKFQNNFSDELVDLEKFENEDFKIPSSRALYYEPWQRATPLSIPGGKLIFTDEVVKKLSNNSAVLIDVRSADKELITAKSAVWLNGMGQAYRNKTYDEVIASRLIGFLDAVTGNNKSKELIFMCVNPICALSYNAARRAIKLDYENVYWYRGGVEAWAIAGLPMVVQRFSPKPISLGAAVNK